METQPATDNSLVVPATANFCIGCKHRGYVGGLLDRKCIREFPEGSQEYPTCLSERAPGGRCSEGQHYVAAYTPVLGPAYHGYPAHSVSPPISYDGDWEPVRPHRVIPPKPPAPVVWDYEKWKARVKQREAYIKKFSAPSPHKQWFIDNLDVLVISGCIVVVLYVLFRFFFPSTY